MKWLLRQRLGAAVAVLPLVVLVGAYLLWYPRPIVVEGTTLEFVSYGDVDTALVEAIAEETASIYGLPYRVAEEALPLPPAAYDTERGKYSAERLLKELARRPVPGKVRVLGITDVDITEGDFNFVFGLARMPGETAVMSLTRLRPKTKREDSEDLLLERAVKIAVHEIGHSFGFGHCSNERCVMSYSDTAAGVDLAGKTFCERCRRRLR
jgi:archaemetzincin